ncbi:MAG: bifunctional riboflavin kinase/FAD synthetase [Ruminococcaceae bacterium]|nr:bifunctional riboflavin kinase/FAD synthetase [Oscillospiraceae bacterium]
MEILDLKHPNWNFEITDCGLCLGNFDGVHRGHRALIEELKKKNAERKEKLPLGAILFRRPPSLLLSGHPVPQLNTFEEKLELLKAAGLRFVILYDFEQLRDMDPDDFVREILIGACHCRLAVCGFNYTYGAKGAGNTETLMKTFGSQPNRTLSVLPPVADGSQPVSSSVIRSMLERGHPEDAARLLGRPFFITGTVTDGKHIGNAMGFPTANLSFPKGGLIPAHGVYVSTVRIGRRTFTGISNVGTRPTFDDGEDVNCETFIFDFHGNLYGKTLRVSFLRFLRAEKKFPSVEALEAQIKKDIARAKEYL